MNNLSDYPDQISLKGMSFHGYTGVFDFEKQNGQTFLVDLTLCFSGIRAADTDKLADTVHYGEVFDTVKKIVETARFDLIEYLAGEIIRDVFAKFPLVQAVEAIVTKPEAPVEGVFESISVRIFRELTENTEAGGRLL
ncbi:MAG: dihydroneopterin aldolase [Eubacteriales bacterium]